MRRWGENSLRTERRESFYPIYVKNEKIVEIGSKPDDHFHPSSRNLVEDNGTIAIWPIDQDGVERRWNFGLDSIYSNIDRIAVINTENGLDLFLTHELTVPKTVWTGGEFDAGKYGNSLLIDILGGPKRFDFPKSLNTVERCLSLVVPSSSPHIILDYFPGSGTTGHAVINLNREDGGDRKYILIEMGEHFDTVLVPRLKKVIYSKDWKDGKPQSRNTGISHCFKILRLESYEDTLNNLRLHRTREQELALEKFSPEAREDYQLGYMLDLEAGGSQSLLNVSAFTDPFDYTLQIATGTAGETKPTQVDLVETFNWLLGLTVLAQGQGGGVTWVEGTNPEGEKVLVLWRNTTAVDAEALNAWCKKQKISVLDGEFAVIYVNGDHHLENLRKDDQTWKVRLTDEEFPKLMWEGCE